MPKATITMPSGATITIEGRADEIERIVKQLEGRRPKGASQTMKRPRSPPSGAELAIKDYVLELREAGLFKKPQGLTDIKNALDAEGHIVPITTLSGVMLGLVKFRELRRFREGKTWKYVNR